MVLIPSIHIEVDRRRFAKLINCHRNVTEAQGLNRAKANAFGARQGQAGLATAMKRNAVSLAGADSVSVLGCRFRSHRFIRYRPDLIILQQNEGYFKIILQLDEGFI